MAESAPYWKDGRWWIDKDPDDERYCVGNVLRDLVDGNTTAVSFEVIVQGVTLLETGTPQGERGHLLPVKLSGFGPEGTESFCTFRVTCANTERFDRTVWFNRVDN